MTGDKVKLYTMGTGITILRGEERNIIIKRYEYVVFYEIHVIDGMLVSWNDSNNRMEMNDHWEL